MLLFPKRGRKLPSEILVLLVVLTSAPWQCCIIVDGFRIQQFASPSPSPPRSFKIAAGRDPSRRALPSACWPSTVIYCPSQAIIITTILTIRAPSHIRRRTTVFVARARCGALHLGPFGPRRTEASSGSKAQLLIHPRHVSSSLPDMCFKATPRLVACASSTKAFKHLIHHSACTLRRPQDSAVRTASKIPSP